MGSVTTAIPSVVNLEDYSPSDTALLASKSFTRTFGDSADYVEMHVYSGDGTLISSNYAFTGYSIPGSLQGSANTKTSLLEFKPDQDLQAQGFVNGTFDVQYNVLKNRLSSSAAPVYFISDISRDRTEIRVASNLRSNADVETTAISFIADLQASTYYKDFLLDFGRNKFALAVNLALDKNTNPYSLLIKLYKPLDISVNVNDSFWVVEELSDPYTFSVELFPDVVEATKINLRGPNFDVMSDHSQIKPSDYQNYNQLLNNAGLSTYQQIITQVNSNNIQINIDYSDYSAFVHFSSAKERLLNFVYKIQQIEQSNAQISMLSSSIVSPSVSSSISTLTANINSVIHNFDGYENYLYSTSSSLSWPKVNDTLPYILFPSTSPEVTIWLGSDDSFAGNYGGQVYSASFYDSENPNNLVYTIPEYLRADPQNESYELFMEMIGQHFDYIWTYIKAFGDLYKANNSLTKGISKDLVYHALRSFGIKVYNSKSDQNVFEYLLGVTVSGSYLPVTSRFETLVTASAYTIPGQDNIKEIYKRIYHNVPYLLKTKGTDASLRALSTAFGVPSTILRFNEYGGMDKQAFTSQYSFDRFSYALVLNGSSSVSIGWDALTLNDHTDQPASFPNAIEFRFKPDIAAFNKSSEQVLMEIDIDNATKSSIAVVMIPSSSAGPHLSDINLYLTDGTSSIAVSSPISLPFYYTGSGEDASWWNVLVRRRNPTFALENDLIDFDIQFVTDSDVSLINVGQFDVSGSTDQTYDIFVNNQINGQIGQQGSASIFVSQSTSASYNNSWDTSGVAVFSPMRANIPFYGWMQEIRFWNESLFQSRFNYHTLNPESVVGNTSASFYNNLAGRFALGNDLATYDHALTGSVRSIHPLQAAVFPTASFISFQDENNYIPNYETYYGNVPVAGYSSPVTDKIRIENSPISSSVLSPFVRLEIPPKFPLTKDLHFINASFSPQNEIDEDIIASLGSTFNIDNYIGDPGQEGSDKYPDLDNLKLLYFQQYISKFDYKDYIRLIKYFDNSLFKMLGDFVAARANLSTGITIRSTLIERSKVKRHQPKVEVHNNFSASIGGASLIAGNGYVTGYGDGSDVYSGELSGSNTDVHKYFQRTNRNPYAIFGHNTVPTFQGGEYDVLVNNVDENVTSSIRKAVDENGSLLIPVSLQDYYYELRRSIIPRYIGSKSTSLTYNFYSSQSFSGSVETWLGDSSYGKSAAIDANTLKFGWVKQIAPTNLNFFDKTSVILKYLVDGSGSLTELSRHNYNVVEVQNTFKSGTPTIVSLSDLLNPSNQTTLDGNKNIFEGGFSYWPIVYRETAEQLHYRYLTSLISTASLSLTAIQHNLFQYNSKPAAGPFKNIDNDTNQGYYTLTYGTSTLSSGQFAFDHIFPFSAWSYASQPGLKEVGSVTLTSGSGGGAFFPNPPVTEPILTDINQFVYQINNNFFNLSDITSSNDSFSQYVQLGDGSYAYKVPRTSTYNFKVDIPFNMSLDETANGPTIMKVLAVLEKSTSNSGTGPWTFLASSTFSYVESSLSAQYAWTPEKSLMMLDFDSYFNGNDSPLKMLCSINSNISLNANDYVRVSFFLIRLNNFLPANGVDFGKISIQNKFSFAPFDMQAGTMVITDTINQKSVVTSDGFYTDNVFFNITGSQNNILDFPPSASLLYGKVIFDQASISSSTAQLYSPIDYPFTFEVGDIVRLTSYFSNNPTYYRINQVIPPVTGSDGVTVFSDLEVVLDKPVNVIGGVSANFVIFRRLPDETSVILNFNKIPGETSQALLIPYDIDLDVKADVANIVTQISTGIQAL